MASAYSSIVAELFSAKRADIRLPTLSLAIFMYCLSVTVLAICSYCERHLPPPKCPILQDNFQYVCSNSGLAFHLHGPIQPTLPPYTKNIKLYVDYIRHGLQIEAAMSQATCSTATILSFLVLDTTDRPGHRYTGNHMVRGVK